MCPVAAVLLLLAVLCECVGRSKTILRHADEVSRQPAYNVYNVHHFRYASMSRIITCVI